MKNYSIAEFGSQLNSNFDKYSDKDLLIAAENVNDLIELHKQYTALGWSVSSYSYSKLKYLSNKGSLFLSHLKLNSNIIFDFKNTFKQIIDEHLQKEDYNNELVGSINYFNVISYIPDLRLGYAWFADCFYVGLRNFLIFENANKGIFEFSYLNMIEFLLKENKINKKEYHILRELRVVKYNYRENILDELPQKSFVSSLLPIAERFNIMPKTIFVNPQYYQNYVLDMIHCQHINGYQRLRLLEGIYCSKEINIPEIKKIISNPQFYASKLSNNTFLDRLIDMLAKGEFDNLISSTTKKEYILM